MPAVNSGWRSAGPRTPGGRGGCGRTGLKFEKAIFPVETPCEPRQRVGVGRGYNGFHGSTLDEVAATAGFSKGAVYSNFKSKDDLFLELFHDRVDRQFAVVSEALETGSHDQAEQFPRIRQILGSDTSPWDDSFFTLWLEFILYARRNPDAQKKLAASAQRARAQVQTLIEHEYEVLGAAPNYPTADLAEIGMALFNGLGIDRLVDPSAVTDQMLDTTLSFLFDAMGVDRQEADNASEPLR